MYFEINQNLNCDSMNFIQMINDLKCKISSIGCTEDSMKVRFKSHIKYGYQNCEVSVHYNVWIGYIILCVPPMALFQVGLVGVEPGPYVCPAWKSELMCC